MRELTEKSILEQVLELPVESVAIIDGARLQGERTPELGRTVLHRTGPNGWIATRVLTFPENRYLTPEAVRKFFESLQPGSAKVTVLVEGRNL